MILPPNTLRKPEAALALFALDPAELPLLLRELAIEDTAIAPPRIPKAAPMLLDDEDAVEELVEVLEEVVFVEVFVFEEFEEEVVVCVGALAGS